MILPLQVTACSSPEPSLTYKTATLTSAPSPLGRTHLPSRSFSRADNHVQCCCLAPLRATTPRRAQGLRFDLPDPTRGRGAPPRRSVPSPHQHLEEGQGKDPRRRQVRSPSPCAADSDAASAVCGDTVYADDTDNRALGEPNPRPRHQHRRWDSRDP